MGQAFLGREVLSGQEVVIKVMHQHLASDPRARVQFKREFEVMSRFQHPHAVALLDGDTDCDRPFLILEYVSGASLEDAVQRAGRFDVERVGRLLGQLCLVLDAAHSRGILHRDLTAANIRLAKPRSGQELVKVMDFGLARSGAGFFVSMEKLSGSGHSIGGGTPDYMSPEQIRGETVDQRADLYSVGVLLFKLLTGRLPFADAQEVSDILLAHRTCKPPRFQDVGASDVPPDFEEVVQRCLAKQPQGRPQSARELAAAYGAALGQAIVDDADWDSASPQDAADAESPCPATGTELDHLEAWMPEQIAAMKLRAFIEGVGGAVVDSVPGMIRVRIPDFRKPAEDKPTGMLALFGFGRKRLTTPTFLELELWMAKKHDGQRSLIEIRVLLPDPVPGKPNGSLQPVADEEGDMRRGYGERICRELRAYLMIGR